MLKVLFRYQFRGYSTVEPIIELSSEKLWVASKADNALLEKLVSKSIADKIQVSSSSELHDSVFNSARCLPITTFNRKRIFEEVESDIKIAKWRKPVLKWWRLSRTVYSTFKVGIMDTYRVYRDSKSLSSDLGTELFRKIEYLEIEARQSGSPLSSSIGIQRREFQEWRHRDQVWKLPRFGLLVLLFEEFSLGLLYLWPSICPWNCLTPGAFKRISDRRAGRLVVLPPCEGKKESYLSVYTVPSANLLQYITKIGLLPYWKSKVYNWSNTRRPAEILRKWHQYLFVDNWIILRILLSVKDKPLVISDRDLVNIIFERQLYNKGEDLNAMVQTKNGQQLMLSRLFIYLSWHFNDTVSVGGTKLFSEKWGVNNVGVLNFPGSAELLCLSNLKNIMQVGT
ncbi:Pnt1p Ecym_2358 [Eremothecium cymbalariae DBVPG|uniref:Uncharacterized protein n=1 Tax=Eremothecium cymbalariae (strain CBS 270.75 / DBVPG 7215 / KCTC 17166 / NRRL Y-17582) TaxID=931890 RepID=G8JNM4_ERECY|nr:Hypothetical protein Ecym_2358 [Eremothecium cymbalariae DBVPG\